MMILTFSTRHRGNDPYIFLSVKHRPKIGLSGELPADPGDRPAYESLTNNIGTQFLELSVNKWPAGTTTFVKHHVLAKYIQDTAVKTGVHESTLYNTQVKRVVKDADTWRIETST